MAIFILGRIPRMLVERYKRQTINSPMELLPDHGLLGSLVDKLEGPTMKTPSRLPSVCGSAGIGQWSTAC